MKLLILKTDIRTKRQLNQVKPVFRKMKDISKWTIDMDDTDRVLRLETKIDYQEADMIELLQSQGINCEELPD